MWLVLSVCYLCGWVTKEGCWREQRRAGMKGRTGWVGNRGKEEGKGGEGRGREGTRMPY
jgi:hypothetical protein